MLIDSVGAGLNELHSIYRCDLIRGSAEDSAYDIEYQLKNIIIFLKNILRMDGTPLCVGVCVCVCRY